MKNLTPKTNSNNQKQELKCNQLSESELINGRNGIALFHDWSRLPKKPGNCSRDEIARSYRLKKGF